jgi:hypothetical protein
MPPTGFYLNLKGSLEQELALKLALALNLALSQATSSPCPIPRIQQNRSSITLLHPIGFPLPAEQT